MVPSESLYHFSRSEALREDRSAARDLCSVSLRQEIGSSCPYFVVIFVSIGQNGKHKSTPMNQYALAFGSM